MGGGAYTRCYAPGGAMISRGLRFVPGLIVIGSSYHIAVVKDTTNRRIASESLLHQQRYFPAQLKAIL